MNHNAIALEFRRKMARNYLDATKRTGRKPKVDVPRFTPKMPKLYSFSVDLKCSRDMSPAELDEIQKTMCEAGESQPTVLECNIGTAEEVTGTEVYPS